LLVGAPFDNGDYGAAWLFGAVAYPPTAAISAPVNGGSYAQGSVVDASFSCQAGGGGTLKSGTSGCAGTVANGQPIYTSTPGTHTFTVTATDTDGQATTVTATYTVTASSGGGSGGSGGGGSGGGGSGGGGSGGTGAGGPGSGGGSIGGTGGSGGLGGTCRVSVGGAKVNGTTALLPVGCGASGSSSRVSLTLSVVETSRATTARSKHGKHKVRKRKSTVVVGRSAVSVSAGAHDTVRISLSPVGRRLLAHQRSLRVTLQITAVEGGRTVVIGRRTVTFRKSSKHHGKRLHHGGRKSRRSGSRRHG
ncbi:MAG: hypothetical protein ACYCXW_12900, partial [Solirubrobacteraceae bacterium]